MKHIYLRELKLNLKTLVIWSFTVGLMGLACMLTFKTMKNDIEEMGDMFSGMGAFSDAFGMSTLSIATLKGFFATEVGTVHGLGGAMFAALMAIGIVSKEEDRHSGEFLLSLPVSRSKVLAAKGLCVLSVLVLFTVVCGLLYLSGFFILGEHVPGKELFTFLVCQMLMNIEIAGICFLVSALSTRIKTGAGLGIALIFYVYDIVGRVVPDLKDYLFMGPFSYANASEIMAGEKTPVKAVVTGLIITIICVATAFYGYNKRDLAS